jgi:CHAT domain-containing protein
LTIREKAFGPNHPDVVGSLNNLAVLYEAEGRYEDALTIVKRTIAQDSAQKSIGLNVLYVAASKGLIPPAEALKLSYLILQLSYKSATTKAVSLLAARFAAGSDELAQLVRKDQDLTAEAEGLDKDIIAALSKPAAERDAMREEQIRKRISAIELRRDDLQALVNRRFPDYVAMAKPQPLSMEDTQALLADDEAVIASDFAETSYVWVITKSFADWRRLSIRADDLAKEVTTLRRALDPGSPRRFDESVAYQVYQQVLGPIENVISSKTRLSFILSGALTSLPPQVLIASDPTGKELASFDWLTREYAVTVLPSVASLKILRHGRAAPAGAKPMIGFGDPVLDRTAQIATKPRVAGLDRSVPAFYRGVIADTKLLGSALPPLPETADELRGVAQKLGASPEDIKLGEAASVSNVKHAPLDNYRLVYFATHALVAGEVEKLAKAKAEPALVLSIPDQQRKMTACYEQVTLQC